MAGQNGDVSPTPAPTQVEHPWKATIRSVFQFLVALATLIPLIALGVYEDPDASPAVVVQVLAVAAAITRVMAIPRVNDLLARFGLGAER